MSPGRSTRLSLLGHVARMDPGHSSPRCTRLCHRSSNGAAPTLRLEEASRSSLPHVDSTNRERFYIVSSPRMDPRHSWGSCDEIGVTCLCYPSVLKEEGRHAGRVGSGQHFCKLRLAGRIENSRKRPALY